MNYKKDISGELEAIAPAIAAIGKTNVFRIPAGYFDSFHTSLLQYLKNEGRMLPQTENILEIPVGYFDTLSDSIMGKIRQSAESNVSEELKTLSPVLYNIGKQNVFSVPEGYFDNLESTISINRPVPAKIISMSARRSIVQYAVAAVITGFLGLSLFSVFNNKGAGDIVPDNVAAMSQAKEIINTGSFEEVLAGVSEAEIVGYLKNSGDDVNAALVANAAFTSELPSADDYILNDKTLDEFLKDLNIDNYSN